MAVGALAGNGLRSKTAFIGGGIGNEREGTYLYLTLSPTIQKHDLDRRPLPTWIYTYQINSFTRQRYRQRCHPYRCRPSADSTSLRPDPLSSSPVPSQRFSECERRGWSASDPGPVPKRQRCQAPRR